MNTLRGNGNKKYRGPKTMEMTGQKKKLIREKGWFYVGFENLSPFSGFFFLAMPQGLWESQFPIRD